MLCGLQLHDDVPPPPEVAAMVAVLESRHGAWAADVADFFATAHALKGAEERSRRWAGVADLVRQRVEARTRAFGD
jgi:hypothetical protein